MWSLKIIVKFYLKCRKHNHSTVELILRLFIGIIFKCWVIKVDSKILEFSEWYLQSLIKLFSLLVFLESTPTAL